MRRILFAISLALSLAACGGLSINVNLDSANVTVPAAVPTLGKVIFPKDPSNFLSSPVNIRSVSLEGQSSASNVVATVKAFVYARTADPAPDSNCTVSASVVICDAASQTKVSGELTLNADGSKTPFKIDDPSGVLRDGVNKGKIWLGFEITQGASVGMTLRLTDLVARVTLF
jgi:hypothetical protein